MGSAGELAELQARLDALQRRVDALEASRPDPAK